jgi:hypothetical protein
MLLLQTVGPAGRLSFQVLEIKEPNQDGAVNMQV